MHMHMHMDMHIRKCMWSRGVRCLQSQPNCVRRSRLSCTRASAPLALDGHGGALRRRRRSAAAKAAYGDDHVHRADRRLARASRQRPAQSSAACAESVLRGGGRARLRRREAVPAAAGHGTLPRLRRALAPLRPLCPRRGAGQKSHTAYHPPPTHYLLLLYQAFLKRSGTDLLYFAFNMPMDLLLLCSSGFSVSLWLSLNAYQAQSPSPSPNPSPTPYALRPTP